MPLDTTDVGSPGQVRALAGNLGSLRPSPVVLNEEGGLGDALRAARESLGLAVEDIAQATRVRPAHIAALEAFDLDAMPARPFAIGYVRAYARALGVEPDALVQRFLAQAPAVDDALRPPSGLSRAPRRLGVLGGAGLLIAASLLAWNVTRHAKAEPGAARVIASRATSSAAGDAGPAKLGAPLPPPPEATTPPAYATPGLGTPVDDAPPIIGARFAQNGAIYGSPTQSAETDVVLQARKATSVIVRGPAGSVVFARELAPGEAWRAPASMAGLTVDVGNASAVEVFGGGVSKGVLASAKIALSHLTG